MMMNGRTLYAYYTVVMREFASFHHTIRCKSTYHTTKIEFFVQVILRKHELIEKHTTFKQLQSGKHSM